MEFPNLYLGRMSSYIITNRIEYFASLKDNNITKDGIIDDGIEMTLFSNRLFLND
jgi:hypothetical protein